MTSFFEERNLIVVDAFVFEFSNFIESFSNAISYPKDT
jgi:hypothetical protein